MLKYRSIRDPILYLVDEYFKNKQFINTQREAQSKNGGGINTDTIPIRDNLPEYPVLFIQDDERYVRAIHGNYEYLEVDVEADIRIWQEEFIYDADGKCIEIKITYPDGGTVSRQIIYNDDDQAVEIK